MFALLRALPLIWQLGIAAAGLATLAGGYALWHHKVYRSGYDACKVDVDADNKEAIDARNAAVGLVRECRASGRVWDTTTGQCR